MRACFSREYNVPFSFRAGAPVPVTYVLGISPVSLMSKGPSYPHGPVSPHVIEGACLYPVGDMPKATEW